MLTFRSDLSEREKAEVKALAEEVRRVDGVELKLDWDLMAGDTAQINDFAASLGTALLAMPSLMEMVGIWR